MMNRKKIYLSIPISGKDLNVQKALARNIAQEYMSRYKDWEVITPFEIVENAETISYEDAMEQDLRVLRQCQAILMAPGWRESNGCLIEFSVARSMGIGVFEIAGNKDRKKGRKHAYGKQDRH